MILNSKTGKIRKDYTVSQLKKAAHYMRGLNLIALNCAGSGHAGGTLSIMDIAAALYLKVARHDPKNPGWSERDRIIWSAGHKAPALYLSLGMAGYFPVEEVVLLRKFDAPFQGHPHWPKLAGVEASTGSLGQGLGIGVGIALRGKLDRKDYKVYVITGDGEWDEGSMWESAMEANHYKLDNLIVVVDRNYLQIDGNTEDVMKLNILENRLSSFGFEVIKIDGHNMTQILKAFKKAGKVKGKPLAIVARTIKGKGVSFMENIADWHGKAPDDEQLEKALAELKLLKKLNVKKLKEKAASYQKKITKKIEKLVPKFSKNYFWNGAILPGVKMEPTRFGFGKALEKHGGDKRIVCLGLDISDSVKISDFYKNHLDRKKRFLSMGIAEQSATTVAAGLAKEGKLSVLSTYGVFCSQRNADQMRTTVCYGDFNVLFGGAHGGISVGPDGATHQSLEEISIVSILPNMHLVVPCDSLETEKATEHLLFKVKGPKYLRFAREATPIVTDETTPFVFGKANVIRLRSTSSEMAGRESSSKMCGVSPSCEMAGRESPGKPRSAGRGGEATTSTPPRWRGRSRRSVANFKDAFETILASKYKNEGEKVALIACGPMVPEAMRAVWILREEYGIEARVLNVHTIKPLDKEAIIRTAKEVDIIVTAEEHQKGGFGNLVAATIMEAGLLKAPKFAMIGVDDRFGESGAPWELMEAFGLTAEFIARKVLELASSD